MRAPGLFGGTNAQTSRTLLESENREKGGATAAAPFDRNALVPRMIAARAETRPDAVAVGGETPLTYGALEKHSNRLARYLEAQGCRRETVVGVAAGRSPELIIAALAVMKAGGAYLPIDSSWPFDRVRHVLDDARAPIVIIRSQPNLPMAAENQLVVALSDLDPVLEWYSDAPVSPALESSQLAYVIYTSGSTGAPKGVEITHRNLLNLVEWHNATFGVTSADRATLLASPGFDASVWEIWPNLCAGASLFIPGERTRLSPEALRDWLVSEHITVTFAPTPIAQRLMFLDWPRETRLRLLLTGADVLQKHPPSGLPFAVINNYGPTECTVVATSGPLRAGESETPPSIGKPIRKTEIHILDENLQEVPPGSAGELCIGGASVGRGYRGDPALTRLKFVPDTFRSEPSARLYRTGDRARMLPDGSIEFIGRLDDQIKLHGYRIDPNEVARHLSAHPGVHSCVVRKHVDSAGSEALLAYIVPAQDVNLTAAHLREHLRALVPDYMIPGAFVRIDALPLNSSGKVDRDALPWPHHTNLLPEAASPPSSAPPSLNETEAALSTMISKLLSRAHIGPHDNFFLAGGHSLLGAQLLIQIRARFGVDLPLRAIFDHPTIAGIALEIEKRLPIGNSAARAAASGA